MTSSRKSRWPNPSGPSDEFGPGEIDASVYTDPERFTLERERLFRRVWHVAGRIEQIAAPGEYLLWERLGQSVVIARRSDGGLAAFHNVCRHRGARIVSESGLCERERFVCPFHAFTYDLEGRVVDIPERDTFDPRKIENLRAHPVAVETLGGWLWIHLDPTQAPRLTDYLGELVDELAWYGMEEWAYYGGSTYEVDANWKIVLEGFLEAWHTPTVHAASTRGGFDVARSSFATFAPHSMMVVPLAALDIDSAPTPVEHRQYADCQYLLFPNAFLNMFPDQGYLITVHPTGQDRSVCQSYVVARKSPPDGTTAAQWRKNVSTSLELMDRIMGEDLEIAATIARNRHSFGYHGNLYSSLECRLTAFHEQVNAYLVRE